MAGCGLALDGEQSAVTALPAGVFLPALAFPGKDSDEDSAEDVRRFRKSRKRAKKTRAVV